MDAGKEVYFDYCRIVDGGKQAFDDSMERLHVVEIGVESDMTTSTAYKKACLAWSFKDKKCNTGKRMAIEKEEFIKLLNVGGSHAFSKVCLKDFSSDSKEKFLQLKVLMLKKSGCLPLQ